MDTLESDRRALRQDYLRPHRGHALAIYEYYLDRFVGWCVDNRGKGSVVRHDVENLAWLSWQASVCGLELTRLWAYFASDDPAWHGDDSKQ